MVVVQKVHQNDEVVKYWQDQLARLGRKSLFIDSGAILESFNPDDFIFSDFFESLVGERLITSTYVLTETARRLIKTRQVKFKGPSGERKGNLVLHMLNTWLADKDVEVICIPLFVFDHAKAVYKHVHSMAGCDLNDTISYTIVSGLEQNRIVSQDSHFAALELTLLP